ncbi:MAG: radical SAM protein [Promethearchaeati archaeon SRVP18_Atabeyarchaeia-1]
MKMERGNVYAPACAVWEVTLKCNMRCLHCGSSAGKARPDELTTEESIRLCSDLKKIGCGGVALIGGEVFLRDDWFEIAEEVKRLRMSLSIVSNGLMIDERMATQISKLEPDAVGISIDGSNPGTHDHIRSAKGSFTKSVKALSLLKDKKLPVSIITAVHKLNFRELPEIGHMILKKDIVWQIQMASPFGRFSEEYMLSPLEFYSVGLFMASLRKKHSLKDMPVAGAHDSGYYSSVIPFRGVGDWNGCQAGITNLGIQSNGNVKGCLALPDDFIEGNVRERGLVNLWNDADSFAYNRRFKESSLSGFCRTCPHAAICRGGCLSVAYNTAKRRENAYCYYRIESDMRKG